MDGPAYYANVLACTADGGRSASTFRDGTNTT
jgi:hypothetical protein